MNHSKHRRYHWHITTLLLLVVAFTLITVFLDRAIKNNASATLKVNTSVSSLEAQKNLQKTQEALKKSFERLSSGLSSNTASDDAGGLGVGEEIKSELMSIKQFMDSAAFLKEVLKTTDAIESQLNSTMTRILKLINSASGSNLKTDRAAVDEAITLLNKLDKQMAIYYSLTTKPGLAQEINEVRDLLTTQRQIINTVIKSTANLNKLTPKKIIAEKNNILPLLKQQIELYHVTQQDLIDLVNYTREAADDEVEYARDL